MNYLEKYNNLRLCQFRDGVQLWECYCNGLDAIAAINFVRFLSGPFGK